jgi:MFS family permease
MTFATRPGYCWIVLAAGTLAVFAALGLARFGYSVVLPSMQAGLALDNTQAGALATANLAGYLTMAAVGGALASHLGPRLVIAAGLAVAGVAMIMTGLSDSFYSAAAWRCLTGVGSGAANIAVMGMWTAWFPANRRGFAAGIAVSGSAVALILVGPLVPLLLKIYGPGGWRSCWYLFGAASVIIAVLCLLLVRNRGVTSISLSTPYAAGTPPPPAATSSWVSVYRSRAVWHLGLVYVAFGFSYIIFMTFFVKHLTTSGGYDRTQAGNLFMVMGWASLFGGFLWGAISDRIGRKQTLVMVYLLHATSFALFGMSSSPVGFTISAVLYGLSAFSIPAIMAAACGDVLGPKMAPAALGFVTLFFGIGQALAPSVAGIIADISGSFSAAFLLASGVALLGAFGSITLASVTGSSN